MATSDDLLTDHLPRMRRYARALARDGAAADDLVQSALLRAIESGGMPEQASSRRSWLLTIIHNLFVSEYRRGASERRRNARIEQIQDWQAPPEQEHATYLRQIAERFHALPHEQRAVLHLIVVEGLSYQEAAAALQVPIGTIMSRLSRGRSALRREAAEPNTRGAELRLIRNQDAD